MHRWCSAPGRAVTLTPAGEAVLPLARRMLADMESARAAVAELVGLQRGRVRVGATPSLCIGVLADVLRVFHERHPAIAPGAGRERVAAAGRARCCATRSTSRW